MKNMKPKALHRKVDPSKKMVGYAHGGMVAVTKRKPTNLSTGRARGAGAATRGTNFKV